jgi:UDP-N-acetylglucosamine:LPS N-acetylglucosamine transferase
MQTRQNVILLPYRSEFYHPDLVNAADAVVGKLGYSTLAEVYRSGVSFGYIPRSNFRESGKMAAFIETEMSGILIEESEFKNGRWTDKLRKLLSISREQPKVANGADQISRFLTGLLT